jgi:predicted HicB family RNase H-like nuclease
VFVEVRKTKNIAFQVDDDLHMDIKLLATKEGKSIKEYILELIKKDLNEKK